MAATITIPIADLVCVCCVDDLEQRLRSNPQLAMASVDYRAGTATLTAHHGTLTDTHARALVREAGYACDREQPSAVHLAHRVATAPITMGTTQDRMQYELEALTHDNHGHRGHSAHRGAPTIERPAESAHNHVGHDAMPTSDIQSDHTAHHTARVADPHAGHVMQTPSTADHAAHGAAVGAQAAHGAHGAHGMHDMSDSAMAADMERDMRNRFVVSLLLTIPTVLYSPVAENLLGIDLPGPKNWIMLALTSAISCKRSPTGDVARARPGNKGDIPHVRPPTRPRF